MIICLRFHKRYVGKRYIFKAFIQIIPALRFKNLFIEKKLDFFKVRHRHYYMSFKARIYELIECNQTMNKLLCFVSLKNGCAVCKMFEFRNVFDNFVIDLGKVDNILPKQ